MADYKSIFTGTLSNLVEKARGAVESSGVGEVYRQGASRTKTYGRIAKLTLEMNGQNEELARVYTEIGRLYFEQVRENPEGFFAPLFAQAETLMKGLKEKETEIAVLKEELSAEKADADGDIEVEISQFEDVVNATEEDGTK